MSIGAGVEAAAEGVKEAAAGGDMKPAPSEEGGRLFMGALEGEGERNAPAPGHFSAEAGSSDMLSRLRMACSVEGNVLGSKDARPLRRVEAAGVTVAPPAPVPRLLKVASKDPREDRLRRA